MTSIEKILMKLHELSEKEPMHSNCITKINRAEVSAISAFIKGKDEGARLLALSLLELLREED